MKTIKTNISRLTELIGNGYSEKKNIELKKGDCEIVFEDYWNINGKEILLYSTIRQITLPDMSFYPQLKSLYGVPAGVLVTKSTNITSGKEKMGRKTNRDVRHIMLRRALLYATVWYIKSLPDFTDEYLYVVRDAVSSILSHRNGFTFALINELLTVSYFPEEQPKKISLSNTHYEFACLWLAKRIGAFFFQGNKMPDECREWFITLRDHHESLPSNAPIEFQEDSLSIMAYVVTQKAITEGALSVDNLTRISSSFSKGYDQQRIVFLSLLFWGLYHSAADRYYYANKANGTMNILEKAAYLLSTDSEMDLTTEWESAFQTLRNIDPKDNCVSYYQTKFPSLRGRSWYDFTNESRPKADDELVLLPPDLTSDFLQTSHKVFDIETKTSSSIFLINESFASDFEKYKFSYICKKANGKHDVVLRNYSPKKKLEVVTMSDLATVRSIFPFAEQVCPIVNPKSKVWILQISENKGFNSFVQSLLTQTYTDAKPELIMMVYHRDTSPNEGMELFSDGQNSHPNNDGQIAILQRKMESLFPSSRITIISHDDQQSIWESVTMGEKILERYDLADISILEFRSKKGQTEPASFVLRMIRDVLVYDDQMKYMFMNLN